MRRSPQRGFSRPKRRIRLRSSSEIGGRPRRGRKPKADQCLRTNSRCQRSSVAGEKSKRPGGNLKPSAARIIRSAGSRVRPLDLPTQNGDLVPEGENLEVALGVRAAAQDGQADRQPQQHIDRRVEHEAGE